MWYAEVYDSGSPPAEIRSSRGPDRLQTEISETSTEMAGGSLLAHIDICVIPEVLPIATSVKTVMSDKSMEMDTPDGVVNSMEIAGGSPPAEFTISESPDRLQTVISVTSTEMAGGNPPADRDNCESPELLQRAGSVTAVVSEKWMERFVIKPKVICSDDSAPDDDLAGRSSDASSIAGVVVCWSLTSLCHSNGHIETMPAREINPFTALTRIRSQFLRTQ